MGLLIRYLKPAVGAVLLMGMFWLPGVAKAQSVGDLLLELQGADDTAALRIERELRLIWDRSGSATADFLMRRGQDAMEREEFEVAIEHYTAVTDHAPDFAAGFHARAVAYFRANLYGPALFDLEMALRLNPDNYIAIRDLGGLLERLNQPEAAYAAYSQVTAIHPQNTEAKEALERLELVVKGREL